MYNGSVAVANAAVVGSAPGTDVMILKIFSAKNSAKNKANFLKNLIKTLVFEKNANFFRRKLSKNRRKS
jgi:hypothetical protein